MSWVIPGCFGTQGPGIRENLPARTSIPVLTAPVLYVVPAEVCNEIAVPWESPWGGCLKLTKGAETVSTLGNVSSSTDVVCLI